MIEVKWHLRNGKILAEDRGAVVVSNHQSSIDILGKWLTKGIEHAIVLTSYKSYLIANKVNVTYFLRFNCL